MHLRLVAVVGLLGLAAPAHAVPAPYMDLPPCERVDGKLVGACVGESPHVYGSAVGRFSFNSSVDAYVDPTVPVCEHWGKYTDIWTPSPCYVIVGATLVQGCGYISLVDDEWHEVGNCVSALYQDVSPTTVLFSRSDPDGYTCGDSPRFDVYALGGDARYEEQTWAWRGPLALGCTIHFTGKHPNALWGPTWVKLRAAIQVSETGLNSATGRLAYTDYWVPIDGDLRNLGPVAAFSVLDRRGDEVRFDNTSVHTADEAMTYAWDFGDGQTSTSEDPTHRYAQPGTYEVTLTVEDESGDTDVATVRVKVDFALLVEVEVPDEPAVVGEPVVVTMTVQNPFDDPVENVLLGSASGLTFASAHLIRNDGPDPALPGTLAPGQEVTLTYELEPVISGNVEILGKVSGRWNGYDVTASDTAILTVPARLRVTLWTSVDAQTKVGDTIDVIATLVNEEPKPIDGIETEPLLLDPQGVLDRIDGPLSAGGTDPRVDPISIPARGRTTVSWSYEATAEGVVELEALFSGRDPYTDGVFFVSADKTIAVATAALELDELRLQPGRPIPGDTAYLRGIVRNIGSVDVTDIDFALTTRPHHVVVESEIERLDEVVRPRIDLLGPEEEQEFIIPILFAPDVGDLGGWSFELEYFGEAEIDGQLADVSVLEEAAGPFDLTIYWTEFTDEVLRSIAQMSFEFIDGLNTWGDESTLGGIVAGGSQAVTNVLRKMGDGLLQVNDLLGEASGDGGQRLSEQGMAIVAGIREYYHTHSPKQMVYDLGKAEYKLLVGGAEKLGTWMFDIDTAYTKGDVSEVTRLLTEPAATIALEAGGELAAGRLWAKFMSTGVGREAMEATLKAPDDFDEFAPDVDGEDFARLLDDEATDLRDLPTGVGISGATVARAGITDDEHTWMAWVARQTGAAFFCRPRPAEAAKWARLGYNAKPPAMKLKSVNEIDVEWLGYDDVSDKIGIVVFREPKDPSDLIKKALDDGTLEWDSKQIEEILERYNVRKAEWDKREQWFATFEKKHKVTRYGKTHETSFRLESDGTVVYTSNGKPIFSDIDLMQIAWPNGEPLPFELYKRITDAAGFGFDTQHGDTASTFDWGLDQWDTAKKIAKQYTAEHMRGGDPLVIVQPDITTLGYVHTVDIPDVAVGIPGRGFYGAIEITYEGAGVR